MGNVGYQMRSTADGLDSSGRVDDFDVDDSADIDEIVGANRYDITSYGVDFDVEGLVKRLKRGDIAIPEFQRNYVWNQNEASRFIESLLLGLPVPGIFLAKEAESQRLLVIDGQQRLKSLQFFYEGLFKPDPAKSSRRLFRLQKVVPELDGLEYKSLKENDRRQLDNALIHATVIKQEQPEDDDTSIYHVFERLNTGGRKLAPQEIRSALYHGPFLNLLKELNGFEPWRKTFGKLHERMKDREMILRFFALTFEGGGYEAPMADFLNRYLKKNRQLPSVLEAQAQGLFNEVIGTFERVLGPRAFRRETVFHAALFDALAVGLASHLRAGRVVSDERIKAGHEAALENSDLAAAISAATGSKNAVETRLRIGASVFS
jgi:Protein of unknown function DUF262